jgi:hypothetical protein
MFKDGKEARTAIAKTMSEVQALLKSWDGLAKAEPEEEAAPEAAAPEAEGQEAPEAEGAEAPESDELAEQAEAEGQEAPEAEGAEGAEGQGSEEDEMAQHAAELSDEQLESMIAVLQAEVEKRHAAQGAEAPEAEGAEAPEESLEKEGGFLNDLDPAKTDAFTKGFMGKTDGGPQLDPQKVADFQKGFMGKSAEAEMKKMVKSMKSEIEGLRKTVEDLRKSRSLPAQRAAIAGSVSAKQKTTQTATARTLSKSETIDFLLGEMRGGNRNVTSDLVAVTNAVRDDRELAEAHSRISSAGIKVPTK